MLGKTGSLNITDPKITGLANTFYSDTVGWIFAAVIVAAYGGVLAIGYRAGWPPTSPTPALLRRSSASSSSPRW